MSTSLTEHEEVLQIHSITFTMHDHDSVSVTFDWDKLDTKIMASLINAINNGSMKTPISVTLTDIADKHYIHDEVGEIFKYCNELETPLYEQEPCVKPREVFNQ